MWIVLLGWFTCYLSQRRLTGKTYNAAHIAFIFFREVIRIHDVPLTIIFGIDVKFVSYFKKTFWKLVGTSLKFSTT